MERKIFWVVVAVLGFPAVIALPLWWAVAATLPIVLTAWWAGYESVWLRRQIRLYSSPSTASRDTTDKRAA